MSYIFEVGPRTVWSPALRVGEIYMAYVRGLEGVYELDAGINPLSEDMAEIDGDVFLHFVQRLSDALSSGQHAVLGMQLRAVILPALVMLRHAGVSDEWVNLDGLAEEARFLGKSMPDLTVHSGVTALNFSDLCLLSGGLTG